MERTNSAANRFNMSIITPLQALGLPLVYGYVGGKKIFFLLDSGSTNNLIRTDLMEVYGKSIYPVEGEGSVYGMDKLVHQTQLFNLTFSIQDQEFTDTFMNVPNCQALDFKVDEKQIHVHGILGTSFFIKNRVVLDFSQFAAYSNSEDSAN